MKFFKRNDKNKRILLSIAAIVIGILSYTATLDVIVQKTFMNIDERGEKYINQTLKNAAYTFAIVRGTNAAISVLQSAAVNISPVGVGMNVGVGEVLDPVNDVVERFSWVMLLSISSLGIQKILMEIGTWFGFKILFPFSMIVILIGLWVPKIVKTNLLSIGYKIVIVSIVIRFCIPVTALAGDKIYELFLHETYIESSSEVKKIGNTIKDADLIGEDSESVDKDLENDESGYLDKLKKMYGGAKASINIKSKIGAVLKKISDISDYIFNLIVVFILQTVIIPILVLWALIKISSYLIGKTFSSEIEQKLKEVLRKPLLENWPKEEIA